jgi:hypothetical protein
MTREDIIRMARETAVQSPSKDTNVWVFGGQELERFAVLVAAAEREACAQVCEAMRPSKPEFDQRYYQGCTDSAAVIRARGEK